MSNFQIYVAITGVVTIIIMIVLSIIVNRETQNDKTAGTSNIAVTDYEVLEKSLEDDIWIFGGIEKFNQPPQSTELKKYIPARYVAYSVYKFDLNKGRYKYLEDKSFPSSSLPEDNLDYRYVRIKELTGKDIVMAITEKTADPVVNIVAGCSFGGGLIAGIADEFSLGKIILMCFGVLVALKGIYQEKNKLRDGWWD